MNVEKIIESIRSVMHDKSDNSKWFNEFAISRDGMEEFICLLDSSEYLKGSDYGSIDRFDKTWKTKYNYYCLSLGPRTIVELIFTEFVSPLHCVELEKGNADIYTVNGRIYVSENDLIINTQDLPQLKVVDGDCRIVSFDTDLESEFLNNKKISEVLTPVSIDDLANRYSKKLEGIDNNQNFEKITSIMDVQILNDELEEQINDLQSKLDKTKKFQEMIKIINGLYTLSSSEKFHAFNISRDIMEKFISSLDPSEYLENIKEGYLDANTVIREDSPYVNQTLQSRHHQYYLMLDEGRIIELTFTEKINPQSLDAKADETSLNIIEVIGRATTKDKDLPLTPFNNKIISEIVTPVFIIDLANRCLGKIESLNKGEQKVRRLTKETTE